MLVFSFPNIHILGVMLPVGVVLLQSPGVLDTEMLAEVGADEDVDVGVEVEADKDAIVEEW